MNTGKKTILLLASTGLQQTTTFVLVAFLSRMLSQGEYATFKQGDLVVKTLLPLFVLGIPLSLSYFLPRAIGDYKKQKQFVFQSLIILMALGLIGALGLLVFKNLISQNFLNDNLGYVIPLFSLFLFFEVVTSLMPNYYLGTSQNIELALFSSTFALLRIIGVLVFYYKFQTVYMIVSALAITSGLKFIYMIYRIIKKFEYETFQFNYDDFKLQLLYALPIGISQLVGVFSDMLDKIMVSSLFKPEDYAIFVNGTIDIPFVGLISGSIAAVLLPQFAKDVGRNKETDDKIMNQWKEAICYTAMILIPMMFVLLLYAEGFIKMLFSSKYLVAADIFRIYILKMPVGVATFSTILLATKNNKDILLNSIACVFINLLLILVFAPILGMKGAALATVVSMYILAFLQIYQISKAMKMRISMVMPYRRLLLCFVISTVISGMFYFLSKAMLITNVIIEFFVMGSVFILLNIMLYHVFKIVNLHILFKILLSGLARRGVNL